MDPLRQIIDELLASGAIEVEYDQADPERPARFRLAMDPQSNEEEVA